MSGTQDIDVIKYSFSHRGRLYKSVKVRAGRPKVVTVEAPGRTFERTDWPTEVEVTVCETGRIVHVYVNGKKIR